jgi:hypothetical protein
MQTDYRFTRSFFLCALLLTGVVGSVKADSGTLPIGSSYCTAQVQSSDGATFSGGTGQSPVVLNWTATTATTSGGPESTVFTSKLNTLGPITVKAAPAGTYFYRVCIENASKMAIGFGLYINPAGPAGVIVYGGPSTAVLGQGGNVCEGFSEGSANRVGQSNVPVQWYVELFDGDGNFLGNAFTVLANSVNDRVAPVSGAFFIEACVSNTSNSAATISLSLMPQ